MAGTVDMNALPSNFYVVGRFMDTQDYPAKADRPAQTCVSLAVGRDSYKFYFDQKVASALGLDALEFGRLLMFKFRPNAYVSKKGGAVFSFNDVEFVGFL